MCKLAFRSELIIIQYAIQKLTDFYRNVLITAISISVSALEHFSVVTFFHTRNKMLSYRRETALQGTLVLARSGRLELGDNILRTL